MPVKNILFAMHCRPNTGYAIETLESRFLAVGRTLTSDDSIYFSYPVLPAVPKNIELPQSQFIEFDMKEKNRNLILNFCRILAERNIDTVVGFDQPVRRPCYALLRSHGVDRFVSYWGAPMSQQNTGLKLLLKRLQVRLSRHAPDLYIFESNAMARSAILGRGIPENRVKVVSLGVDLCAFFPHPPDAKYAHDAFGIPSNRKIIYYSGHMEERKGVSVLMSTARLLRERYRRDDFHMLLVGNRGNEANKYLAEVENSPTQNHVTFGGYRRDVARLQRSAYCAAILSTGWDSLTQSAIELAATGIPLIVSDIGGLPETVIPDRTGFITARNSPEISAAVINNLLGNTELRNEMAVNARQFAEEKFSTKRQIERLASCIRY